MPFMPNPHKWHFYLLKLTTLSLVLVFWLHKNPAPQNKKCKFCFLNLHNCEIITTFAAAKVAYRHFELYIDIQAQSVAPLNKRYKQNLSF